MEKVYRLKRDEYKVEKNGELVFVGGKILYNVYGSRESAMNAIPIENSVVEEHFEYTVIEQNVE